MAGVGRGPASEGSTGSLAAASAAEAAAAAAVAAEAASCLGSALEKLLRRPLRARGARSHVTLSNLGCRGGRALARASSPIRLNSATPCEKRELRPNRALRCEPTHAPSRRWLATVAVQTAAFPSDTRSRCKEAGSRRRQKHHRCSIRAATCRATRRSCWSVPGRYDKLTCFKRPKSSAQSQNLSRTLTTAPWDATLYTHPKVASTHEAPQPKSWGPLRREQVLNDTERLHELRLQAIRAEEAMVPAAPSPISLSNNDFEEVAPTTPLPEPPVPCVFPTESM